VAIADLEASEQNLEGLTMNVPDAMVDELPRHDQRHTVVVLHGQLFVKVSNILDVFCTCSHELHFLIFWSLEKHFL
jgi:hypothetical protein